MTAPSVDITEFRQRIEDELDSVLSHSKQPPLTLPAAHRRTLTVAIALLGRRSRKGELYECREPHYAMTS